MVFEFRLATQTGDKNLLVGTTVKPSCLVGEGGAVPQLSIMYPGNCLMTEEKT